MPVVCPVLNFKLEQNLRFLKGTFAAGLKVLSSDSSGRRHIFAHVIEPAPRAALPPTLPARAHPHLVQEPDERRTCAGRGPDEPTFFFFFVLSVPYALLAVGPLQGDQAADPHISHHSRGDGRV